MSEFTESPPDLDADGTATAEAPSPAPAQSSARARAEARRRRILERSQNRMQAVSGGIVNPPKDTASVAVAEDAEDEDEDEPTAVAFTDINATEISASSSVSAREDANTAYDAAAVAQAKSPSSSTKISTTARQLQMRRRRYRQKAAAAKESEASATATASATTTVAEGEETSEAAEAAPAAAVETPVVVEETLKLTTAAAVPEAVPETSSASTGTGAAEEKEKKKYLGVAKMRRKRLAEEKAKQEAALESKLDSDLKSASSDMAKMQNKLKQLSRKPNIALKPILFQLLTVLALFFVGLDVGMQNHAIVNQHVNEEAGENIVFSNIAFVDHGIGALALFGAAKPPSDVESVAMASAAAGFQAEDIVVITEEEEDEFGTGTGTSGTTKGIKKPAGAEQQYTPSNIDPLFGVDFDKLTAGPGIFMMLARFAVSIHRSILYFCYSLPLSIVSSIMSAPKRLFGTPPMWFLLAVFIRYVGKHVLAGGVEVMTLEESLELEAKMEEHMSGLLSAGANGGSGEKKKPDLASSIADTNFMSMGMNFAKNFIKTNFPKMALFVTVLKDARNDMFVVLCGFFVGLVLPSGWVGASSSSASSSIIASSDEL